MAGFLYVSKTSNEKINEIKSRFRASIKAMEKRGVDLDLTIDRSTFSIFVFKKISFSKQHYVSMPNGDFILSVGALIYKGSMGLVALQGLFEDYSKGHKIFSDLIGHFCIFIYLDGKLHVFNDSNGNYHIYANDSKTVLSSSFLAVRNSLETLTISKQELYEYFLTGGMYGDLTLFREIKRLDGFKIHILCPKYCSLLKNIYAPLFPQHLSFDELVANIADSLSEYFKILETNQGKGVISALSGGYDSRLILAAMRKVGIEPKLFVFGPDDSDDVRIAKKIAEGENLPIYHPNYNAALPLSTDKFSEILEAHFYFRDGLGYNGAFIDRELDYKFLSKMTGGYSIRLHGGAGSIFRSRWKLPDRSMTIKEFTSKVFAFKNLNRFSAFTHQFNRKNFFDVLGEKIKFMMQTTSDLLNRAQIESLETLMQAKYWMGPTTGADNLFSYALTPFCEPRFTIPSAHIPLKFKDAGRLEAAIIKYLDPKLARYTNMYGFNFFDPLPKKYLIIDFMKRYSRDYIPHSVLHFFHQRMSLVSENKIMPYYLHADFLQEFLNVNDLIVDEYVTIDKINDANLLNRVLTVELNLQNLF